MLAITDARQGMTVRQVEEMLGVHRSIAYRLLQTLCDFKLVTRGAKGLYLPGPRLATLADSYLPYLLDLALPIMRRVADDLASTIALFVEEGVSALAIAKIEPRNVRHHIAFQAGMSTPMDRGAAAYAILAGRSAEPDEPAAVTRARQLGFAQSEGEVEPGEFGIAATIRMPPELPSACFLVVTHRADIAATAGPTIRDAAEELAGQLDGHSAEA